MAESSRWRIGGHVFGQLDGAQMQVGIIKLAFVVGISDVGTCQSSKL